jgi:hypothetical protein
MALNIYKDIYRRGVHKKSGYKIIYILGNTKKINFKQKDILFYYYLLSNFLSFLYFPKYNVFLTGLFEYTPPIYIYLHI